MMKKFLFLDFAPTSRDAALLLWRVAIGGMMFALHGLPKLLKVGSMPGGFPDPLGIGNALSYWATIGNEVVAALFLVAGLCTRWAALWLTFTMAIAFFVVHEAKVDEAEMALLYMVITLPLIVAGGGRYSLDAKWGANRV
ncbi:DoxX family protein [Actomonas aquatica]|uniref:DoxX family protein n=1 Tax=Actomonas aquatica TaxID=2866162 RepID=A0ABZ1CAA7_9BACT|nr:DoxX family protein [Opitutus sp. WL0086]WRQ87255.1 DoxX family protein [Opitutus sp. WL0086]